MGKSRDISCFIQSPKMDKKQYNEKHDLLNTGSLTSAQHVLVSDVCVSMCVVLVLCFFVCSELLLYVGFIVFHFSCVCVFSTCRARFCVSCTFVCVSIKGIFTFVIVSVWVQWFLKVWSLQVSVVLSSRILVLCTNMNVFFICSQHIVVP